MREALHQIRKLQEKANEEIRKLDQEVVGYAVEHLIDRLMRKYADLQAVTDFLQTVRKDILKNVNEFKRANEMEEAQRPAAIPGEP